MTPLIQGTYSYQVYGDNSSAGEMAQPLWSLNVLPNDPSSVPSMLGNSKLSVTLSIGDPMLSSGFHGYIYKSGMHSHRHTDKPKTKDF